MARLSKKTSRLVRSINPRTPSGVVGALMGATVMSVIAGVLVTAAVTPVVALSSAATSSAISLFENLPGHIDPGQLSQPSSIYAVDGEGNEIKLAQFYAQNRQMIGWDQIAQSVKDAAVSEEDPRFYTHGGVDVLAAGRAVVGNLAGSGRSGASTITMQYVRNMLVQEAELIPNEEEREKAYENATRDDIDRKLQEMRLAISVEKRFSKNDILLGYLNIANFGGQIYGIQSAARSYYDKDAADLTIAESASLVGIVNSPANLNLANPDNIERNQARRDRILSSMLREGKITQEQYEEAVATPVEPKLTSTPSGCSMAEESHKLGHFCSYVINYIRNDPKFGETPEERWFKFQNGGFKITTTIDLNLHAEAVAQTESLSPRSLYGMDYGSAVVSVRNKTGEVLAMTQNRPFSDDQEFLNANPEYTSINYNTDYEYGGSSGFQYGSTVKAFTMAEWLRTGHSLYDRVNISARSVAFSSYNASCLGGNLGGGSFSFENWKTYSGINTALYAMDQSVNGGFVSMAQQLDLCNIFHLAQDMGVHRAVEQTTSESLHNYGTRDLAIVPSGVYNGNDEVAPISLASAYAGFASEGKVCTPVPIKAIKDAQGEDVEFTKSECKQAIDAAVANGVGFSLEHYVTGGLGAAGRSNGTPRMAKTGTTDDYKDQWWVGGSTEVTTAAWNGNLTGAVSLLSMGYYRVNDSIFRNLMNKADEIYGGQAFAAPEAVATTQRMETVPNVDGRSVSEAQAILEAAGFNVTIGEAENSTRAEGQVSRTDPAGGTQAAAGANVTIFASNGKKPDEEDSSGIEVPSGLTGVSAQEAANTLGAAGFSSIVMQCSGSGEPNASMPVTSVSPKSGSKAKANTRITLTINCG